MRDSEEPVTDTPVEGTHASLWLETTTTTDYEPLDGVLSVDTAVVGGGIAGLTTAVKLAEAGQSVALLERDRIVAGVTGHTTAKLTSLHGLPYHHLADSFGVEDAGRYAAANEAAIDDVEATVGTLDADCGFERMPAVTYIGPDGESGVGTVREEVSVAQQLDLPASFVGSSSLPGDGEAGVRFDEQAVFNPRSYLLGLAERLAEGADTHLFEETTVTDVDDGEPCTVTTDRGTVRADDVVLATHFPIVDRGLYFSRLEPKRSYLLAVELGGTPPSEMYYRTGDPHFSLRPLPGEGNTVLVGGQNHRTGHGSPTVDRYRRLAEQARARLDVESIRYRWSTQDFTSVDTVPFVGPSPLADHTYIATGFGGWGMTGGTVAGRLLSDRILGRENDWASLYSPERLTVKASARKFASHNRHSMEHYLEDYLLDRPPERPLALDPGEATVVEHEGESVAAYRDEDGEYHTVSAVCSHMGCLVEWNDGERSWDCPCHGSRFDVDGTPLETPAVEGLEQFDFGSG